MIINSQIQFIYVFCNWCWERGIGRGGTPGSWPHTGYSQGVTKLPVGGLCSAGQSVGQWVACSRNGREHPCHTTGARVRVEKGTKCSATVKASHYVTLPANASPTSPLLSSPSFVQIMAAASTTRVMNDLHVVFRSCLFDQGFISTVNPFLFGNRTGF